MIVDIGDVLTRKKGVITHYALYVGRCANTGVPIVAENQINKGVQIIPLEQFKNEAGSTLKVEKKNFDSRQKKLVKARVGERLGKKYSVVSYNCEHFVNDVLSGSIKSEQVVAGAFVAVGLALAVYALTAD